MRRQREHPLVRIPLAVIDRLRGPISMAGVDYPRFRALLEIRLVLDSRRGRTRSGRQEPGFFGAGLAVACGMNLLFGVFFGFLLIQFDDAPMVGLGLVFTFLMGLLTMVLVVDFAPTLLDTTDLEIVGPTPVDDGTVFAARVAHTVVYLVLVEGSLTVGPAVLGCLVHPPLVFLPVLFVSAVFACIWCVAAAFGLFLIGMRVFDLERLKNALLYVQVVATVAVVFGWQLLGPLLHRADLPAVLDAKPWLPFLLPPLHYGALLETALGSVSPGNLVLCALSVSLPLSLLALGVRLARGRFVSGLTAMAAGGHSGRVRVPRRLPIRELFVRSQAERAGYDFFTALSRRERQFRLRSYPMVAFAVVFGLWFTVIGPFGKHPVLFCVALYYLGAAAPGVVLMCGFSDDHEAVWVIDESPLDDPGTFVSGAMTSLVTTFFLPVLAVLFLCIVGLGGLALLPDALLSGATAMVGILASIHVLGPGMPFCRPPAANAGQGNGAILIGFLLVTGLLAVIHALVRMNAIAFWTWFALILVMNVLAWRAIRHRPSSTT